MTGRRLALVASPFLLLTLGGCHSENARSHQAAKLPPLPLPDGQSAVVAAMHPEVPSFQVLARAPHIAKMPCTRCHTAPTAAMKRTSPAAHWNLELKHAPAATMSCATCHADAATGELRLMQGAPVEFNHVYQVCGQCHSRQEKEWAGGAHGKRAVGWNAPRTAMNCTSCHNPHQPAFSRRWPARAGKTEPLE